MIGTGIIELIKANLILYVLSLANHLGGGGEAGLLGGKLPPLPPPVDRTLTSVLFLIQYNCNDRLSKEYLTAIS